MYFVDFNFLFIFFIVFRSFWHILFILLVLPKVSFAFPVKTESAKSHSSDALRSLLSSLDMNLLNERLEQDSVKLEKDSIKHNILNNIVDKRIKNNIFTRNRLTENSKKESLLSGKLLAMVLYDKSRTTRTESINKKALTDYDPLGGGVWGRKRRSIEEYSDFDYEGDDL